MVVRDDVAHVTYSHHDLRSPCCRCRPAAAGGIAAALPAARLVARFIEHVQLHVLRGEDDHLLAVAVDVGERGIWYCHWPLSGRCLNTPLVAGLLSPSSPRCRSRATRTVFPIRGDDLRAVAVDITNGDASARSRLPAAAGLASPCRHRGSRTPAATCTRRSNFKTRSIVEIGQRGGATKSLPCADSTPVMPW